MRHPAPSKAKRHHLIPEWYLKRFLYDGRRVNVFDCVTRKLRSDVPRNVAVESEFNSVSTTSGVMDRSAESRLADFDAAAAGAFKKLENGDALSRDERWHVAFFAGFADTRGRGFREMVQAS